MLGADVCGEQVSPTSQVGEVGQATWATICLSVSVSACCSAVSACCSAVSAWYRVVCGWYGGVRACYSAVSVKIWMHRSAKKDQLYTILV